MEEKRRSELEEEMSRFEQEIAGQLPPPPKIPSLDLFSSDKKSLNETRPNSSFDQPTDHFQNRFIQNRGLHSGSGSFQPQSDHAQHIDSRQRHLSHAVHPPSFPQPVMPNPPHIRLPPPPHGITDAHLVIPNSCTPLGQPPMPPTGSTPRLSVPQPPLLPPPMPPMLPMLPPTPAANVAVTSSAPVIKPPTVPLDNYEPLPSSSDADGGGDGTGTDKGDDGKKDKKKKFVRVGGGTLWEDDSLTEWDPNDFRIFVGDLGNEVTDEHLYRAFSKYTSVLKARVVRDKKSKKTKGYGFVSFKDPQDYLKAMREMNGKYVGNRPIKLRKSTWKDRNVEVARKKEREKKKLGLR